MAQGVEPIETDVFRLLRQYWDEGRMFDVVVLDPPSLRMPRARSSAPRVAIRILT